jgi:hypothetical protein
MAAPGQPFGGTRDKSFCAGLPPSSGFAQVVNASDGRIIQFALKYRF